MPLKVVNSFDARKFLRKQKINGSRRLLRYLGLQKISRNRVRPAITITRESLIPKASKMDPMAKAQGLISELLRLGERKEIWLEF